MERRLSALVDGSMSCMPHMPPGEGNEHSPASLTSLAKPHQAKSSRATPRQASPGQAEPCRAVSVMITDLRSGHFDEARSS
jgi:hypothetical protein